jgi:hypothetical protein
MKRLFLPGVIGLLALAACQPNPPQQAASRPAAAPAATIADTAHPVAAPPPYTGPTELTVKVPRYLRSYRRYVGALGGREIVLELMPVDDPYRLLISKVYFTHGPQAQLFDGALVGAGAPAKSLKVEMYVDTATTTLVLTPPFGPQLRGFWTAGRGTAPQSVTLHESYVGAVRYEVLTATAKGSPMRPQPYGDEAGSIPSYTRAYLHLLGPDTVRPGLRRLQALTPRRMQRAVRYYLHHEAEGGCQDTEELYVNLNGYDLLSYNLVFYSYMFGGNHPESTEDFRTLDLRTGRPTRWETWFRDDADAALRQLIYRQLLANDGTDGYYAGSFDQKTGMRELPEQYGLTPAGIVAHYGDYVLAPHAHGPTSVLLPFAEVAPLLNPGTPLDRILQARGLRAGLANRAVSAAYER